MAHDTGSLGNPGREPLRRLRTTDRMIPQRAREQNRTLILQTVFTQGPLSRAETARRSGISAVSVSELTAELLRDGVLVEGGVVRHSGAGKPGVLLQMRDDAFQIVALDLSDRLSFVGVVTDLRGAVLHRASVPIGGRTGDDALELLIRLVERLVELSTRPLLGVGIGLPGIVIGGRTVQEATTREWHEIDLAQRIADRVGCPVHVENDANAAARAVFTHHRPELNSLLLVTLSYGVGSGLIVGGALVVGDRSGAGEIGHLVVAADGPPCGCGRRGCLQRLVDAAEVRARFAAASPDRHDEIIAEAGEMLGRAIAPMVAVTGVGTVIVSGPVDIVTDGFLAACHRVAVERVQAPITEELVIEAALGVEDLVLVGVSALVLESELGVA